jgi:membrane associated rhomboid family serine protease
MRYDQLSPIPPLTPVTKVLIIICTSAYFLFSVFLDNLGFQISGLNLNEMLGLVPKFVHDDHWYWQFITYIFMHGHPLHILLNMLILWYFGSELEMRLGKWPFLQYFLVCGIGAGLFNYGVNILFTDPSRLVHPIIGASGAIFGILAAYGIFFGNRYFLVFFLFPMKAKYYVLVLTGIELVMGIQSNAQDNVAHFAHIGGMFVGATYIFLRYMRPRGFGGPGKKRDYEREKLKRQFTLIVNEKPDQGGDKTQGGGPPSYWN